MIKKLDLAIVRMFIGPFIAVFFIALFVLVMQFLWKYIDDLVGKGLEWYILLQLLFYASASMVPLAIPLAMLLASIMTFGALGEHYELTAMKSSGISLVRIFRSMIIVALLVSCAALAFSNYLLPVANLKFGVLLYDIRQQRPALNIRPGVFYNDIDGYSIRVGKKDPDNKTIYDVIIYDHTSGHGNDNVITASKGEMYMTEDKHFLVLNLFNGNEYEELPPSSRSDKKNEQVRISFQEWKKVLDLSDFALTHTSETLFKNNYQMESIKQLMRSIDTLNIQKEEKYTDYINYIKPYYTFARVNLDSLMQQGGNVPVVKTVSDSFLIYDKALGVARTVKGYASISTKEQSIKNDLLVRYKIEFNRKFTLAFACFVLFLIGAPLGAIIRKGGLGWPFVVSVLFFVIYYIISISGEKMAKEFVLSITSGMWLSSFILLPVAFFLIYKAATDSIIMNTDTYSALAKKIFSFFVKRKSDADNQSE